MSALLQLMEKEEYMKMKSQATSCMVSFVRGLINEDEETEYEEEKKKEYSQILVPYVPKLVETISALFSISLVRNYAPLQEEILALLSCLANVMADQFGQYYDRFMPGLKQVLATVPMETTAQ